MSAARLAAWLLVVLLLGGCASTAARLAVNLLPGGSEPQRAIQGGVVQILGLRADFNRFVAMHQQALEAEGRGDQVSAGRLRAMKEALVDGSKQDRLAYRGRVIETARAFVPDTLKAALDAVVARYEEDQALPLIAPARLFVAQVLAYQQDGVERFDLWYAELLR